MTHLYSHLEGSTLTPVPRLIITPETPEPEARPGGPPSQLEAGSGGFSSASSFDESEDDVVAGGGGASDPEDRSGVSGTHRTLEPDPHRPHSPPPNCPTPAFPLRSFSRTPPAVLCPGTSSIHQPLPSDSRVPSSPGALFILSFPPPPVLGSKMDGCWPTSWHPGTPKSCVSPVSIYTCFCSKGHRLQSVTAPPAQTLKHTSLGRQKGCTFYPTLLSLGPVVALRDHQPSTPLSSFTSVGSKHPVFFFFLSFSKGYVNPKR